MCVLSSRLPGRPGSVQVEGVAEESKGPAGKVAGAWRDGAGTALTMPGKIFGRPILVEMEEYSCLQLRHDEPAISFEGEPDNDGLHLRVTGKVIAEVVGRTEEIGIVEPAIVSVRGAGGRGRRVANRRPEGDARGVRGAKCFVHDLSITPALTEKFQGGE
jgi:hypothetical protein